MQNDAINQAAMMGHQQRKFKSSQVNTHASTAGGVERRDSLPPIANSPNGTNFTKMMVRNQHNSSGITDSRRRSKGVPMGILPQVVPQTTRVANQAHSQSIATVDGSGNRQIRVQGVIKLYRKNSNHTQLITKTKAPSLFDVPGPASNLRRSGEVQFNGTLDSNMSLDVQRRRQQGFGRVHSVKRTSNEKNAAARQGYYACQCTENLLTGKLETMNPFDCPDHLPGPSTTQQYRSARNQQLKAQRREAIMADGKTKMVKSAQQPNPNGKHLIHQQSTRASNPYQTYNNQQAQAQSNADPFSSHETQRIVDQCVTGGAFMVAAVGDGQQPRVQMRKTQLSVVGAKHPQFTPQKQNPRKTFHQESNGQPNQLKLITTGSRRQPQNPVPVTMIPAEDIKFCSSGGQVQQQTQGRKKKRYQFGQTNKQSSSSTFVNNGLQNNSVNNILESLSGASGKDIGQEGLLGVKSPEQHHQEVNAYDDHRSSENSYSNEATVPPNMGSREATVSHMQRIQRRLGGTQTDSGQESSQGQNEKEDSYGITQMSPKDSGEVTPEHQQPGEIYIHENQSSQQSVEKQVQKRMRTERELILEKIRRNEEVRNNNHPEQSFESPGKPIKLRTNRSSQGMHPSPHSSGKVKDGHLQPQFSTSNMQAKLQTEVKMLDTPETQRPDLYPMMNNKLRQNMPLNVPPTSLVKDARMIDTKSISSPMVVRLSSGRSSGNGQDTNVLNFVRPMLNLNLLQAVVQDETETDATPDTVIKIKDSPREIAANQEQEAVETKQIGVISNLRPEEESKNCVVTVSHISSTSHLSTPGKKPVHHISKQNIVYDYDKSQPKTQQQTENSPREGRDYMRETQRSRAELESHQKSSRLASAQNHHNSSQTQLERTPQMGDITNMARQQSETEFPLNGTVNAAALSYKYSQHRATVGQKRERSGEDKSSQEEAIRSEIEMDLQIENSDELATSLNIMNEVRRGSGRDFSCIFDADSDGPKQNEKIDVRIDKKLQIELNSVKRGQKLGEGSFGEVYQGLYDGTQSHNSSSYGSDENMLPPQMAIKVVRVEDKRLQKKLESELELLRTLKHRHIVQYYGCVVDEEEKEASIFMELMPHSLQTQYKDFGPLHERVIKRHTKQILDALCYLHNHDLRIIHGDLKAANILSDAGCTKLTDFGDSRKLEALPQDLHASGESGAVFTELSGSILWMAPEFFSRKPVGRRSDIWSLGCTLIELASAKHPWHGIRDVVHLIQKLEMQELPAIPQSLSAEAKDFIKRCLVYDKETRPTAMELLSHPFISDGTNLLQQQQSTITASSMMSAQKV